MLNLNPEQLQTMMHQDVQKFLLVLNGLLDGSKRVVIESKRVPPTGSQYGSDYKHTFYVEDVK